MLTFSSIALILPGVIFLVVALKRRAHANRLQELSALAASALRVPLDAFSAHLRVPAGEAQSMLLEAISAGLVRGRLDLEERVFIAASSDGNAERVSAVCPSCGARAEVLLAPGERGRCPYCSAPLR